MSIDEAKKNRFRFLHRLYEHAGGSAAFDPRRWKDMRELGQEIGLNESDTDSVVQYLTDENLVTWHADDGLLGISHRGVKEIEAALDAPEQPTRHFPAGIGATVNIIHVAAMINSTIQQGSTNASQAASTESGQQTNRESFPKTLGAQPLNPDKRDGTMGAGLSDLDAAILQFLSEHPRGRGLRMPDFRDIQRGAGKDELTVSAALNSLQDRGMVKNHYPAHELGVYEMTSPGTVALRLFYSRSASVQNVLTIEGSTNVTVQQGSPGAVRSGENNGGGQSMDIKQEQADRFLYLHTVWQGVKGSTTTFIRTRDVAQHLRFSSEQASRILQYLKGEGLVATPAMGVVSISHAGIKEVEAALTTPEQPTDHFPAKVGSTVNIISVNQMTNSVIQQASPGASQIVEIKQEQKAELVKLLSEAQKELAQSKFSSDVAAEAKTDIETLLMQLNASKPKTSVLQACWQSLRSILENAAGGVLSSGLTLLVPQMIALFGALGLG